MESESDDDNGKKQWNYRECRYGFRTPKNFFVSEIVSRFKKKNREENIQKYGGGEGEIIYKRESWNQRHESEKYPHTYKAHRIREIPPFCEYEYERRDGEEWYERKCAEEEIIHRRK